MNNFMVYLAMIPLFIGMLIGIIIDKLKIEKNKKKEDQLIILPSDADMLAYIRENEPISKESLLSISIPNKYIEKTLKKLIILDYIKIDHEQIWSI